MTGSGTSKKEYPFILILALYVVAGAAALFLYFSGTINPHMPSSYEEANVSDELYDIRPELNKAQDEAAQEPEQTEQTHEADAAEESEAPQPSEPAQTIEEAEHYYAFTTLNKRSILHVRQEPDIRAKIIYRLPPGSTGFILEQGDKWSKVQTKDITGYCYNQYLDIKEVSKDEYLVWPDES